MPTRQILVTLSDMHGGYKLALCQPEVAAEIGAKLNEVQDWLLKIFDRGISTAVEMAGDDEIVVCHNGDPTHGDRYMIELMTSRAADQVLIAKHNLKRWLDLPNVKTCLMVYGTGNHEFEEGSATSLIADALREGYPGKSILESYHFLADIGGALVDIAHHGPHPGSRGWLHGNIARFYLRDMMQQAANRLEPPPALVMRSHFHTWTSEVVTLAAHGTEYESRIVITPAMCIPDSYARKATRSVGSVSCGLVITEIIDGRPQKPIPIVDGIDLRDRVKI